MIHSLLTSRESYTNWRNLCDHEHMVLKVREFHPDALTFTLSVLENQHFYQLEGMATLRPSSSQNSLSWVFQEKDSPTYLELDLNSNFLRISGIIATKGQAYIDLPENGILLQAG